jgi:hypothetical protein
MLAKCGRFCHEKAAPTLIGGRFCVLLAGILATAGGVALLVNNVKVKIRAPLMFSSGTNLGRIERLLPNAFPAYETEDVVAVGASTANEAQSAIGGRRLGHLTDGLNLMPIAASARHPFLTSSANQATKTGIKTPRKLSETIPIHKTIEVALVFGVAGHDTDDSSKPILDRSFDARRPSTQAYLASLCDRMMARPGVRAEWPCWPKLFREMHRGPTQTPLGGNGLGFPTAPAFFGVAYDQMLSSITQVRQNACT